MTDEQREKALRAVKEFREYVAQANGAPDVAKMAEIIGRAYPVCPCCIFRMLAGQTPEQIEAETQNKKEAINDRLETSD